MSRRGSEDLHMGGLGWGLVTVNITALGFAGLNFSRNESEIKSFILGFAAAWRWKYAFLKFIFERDTAST